MTITTDKGGIKRAASNSTTSNVTQDPINVINKTGTKTTDEEKQIITVSTATKIQKDQIIKKSKTLIRLNSTEKLIDNVNNHIESARNIIENNKDLNINLDQLKNIIISIQGNSDPIDICKQYGTDTKTLLTH
jgi:predicted type IV restriction endonuclease